MYAQTPYMHSSIPLNPRVLECMYAVCACILVLLLSEKHTPPSSNIVRFGKMFFACFRSPHDALYCTVGVRVRCPYVTQDLGGKPYRAIGSK